MEMRLVSEGVSQEQAHIITSRQYDYSKESRDYYLGLQQKVGHKDGQVSGGITILKGNTH